MTTPFAATPLLEVGGLSVDFAAHRVVRGVSFKVEAGEILGIVGESGSGKSLTCRAMLGLQPATAAIGGTIRWRGREMAGLPQEEWRTVRGPDIGMIFQNPSSHLDPLRRVGSQVAAPLRRHFKLPRREAEVQAVELIDAVGIHEPGRVARAYPHQLSGGMKQRIMIAAAISCRPKLLIADEPTTALDVTVQARILELLKKLNRERGLAVILVSHDLGVVADTCTRVLVMRRGEVVEEGEVSEIISRPRHPYTQLLIGSQPRPAEGADDAGLAAPALLEIAGLSVSFPVKQGLFGGGDKVLRALDGVDLEIAEGETVGIVGESGSGKTTLARAIVRLNRLSAGTIRFNGKDVHALQGEPLARFRQQAQMVFQSPYDSLNPRMRAAEAVAEPIWRHRRASRRDALAEARRMLELVELAEEFWNRKPRQLSGGQCQRVGLARALALQPKLLIADEITSALDVTTQAQILELLGRVQRQRGLTLLYITHDLSVVSSFCRRVYVFKDGRIVESGPARQVLSAPSHAYTRELVASLSQLRSSLAHKPGRAEAHAN